jgi:hypothetical protein
VIGAGAVVFTVFQSASLRHRASTTIEQVNTVVANVQSSTFATQDGHASLTTDQAIKAGILKTGLQTHAWGGSVEVSDAGTGMAPPMFFVILRNVPRDACPDILSNVMSNSAWVLAQMSNPGPAGTGTLASGIVVGNSLIASTNYSAMISRCSFSNSSASGDTLDFSFYFAYRGYR